MPGVVKLVEPLKSNVPPDELLYQSIVSFAPTLAEMVTVPGPHLAPFTGFIGAGGSGISVTTTEAVLVQPKLFVMVTE